MTDHCLLPFLFWLLFVEVAWIIWRRGGDAERW